jgi:hypothetical protein
VLSSSSLREGEEGLAIAKDEEEEDPVEVIPVLDFPPRLAYKQTDITNSNWSKRETHQKPSA